MRVGYRDGALDLEVDDDGTARPVGLAHGQASGSGNGIAGMTERAKPHSVARCRPGPGRKAASESGRGCRSHGGEP